MRLSFITGTVFNQNPGKAKKQADRHPLIITDHGKASYVLMRYSDFQAHWPKPKTLLEALSDPNATKDREFNPVRVSFGDRNTDI